MHAAAYALLFVGALAGGFVSGLAGFGTALMALGIWLHVMPPSTAVALVLICSVIAQISTLPSMWRSFDLSLVWPFVIGGLLGVPIGTTLVAQADPGVFKLTVGIFLLVFPLALYVSKPMAIAFGGRFADAAIGVAGGILGGLAVRSAADPVGQRQGLGQGRTTRYLPDLQYYSAVCRALPADGRRHDRTRGALARHACVSRNAAWKLAWREALPCAERPQLPRRRAGIAAAIRRCAHLEQHWPRLARLAVAHRANRLRKTSPITAAPASISPAFHAAKPRNRPCSTTFPTNCRDSGRTVTPAAFRRTVTSQSSMPDPR